MRDDLARKGDVFHMLFAREVTTLPAFEKRVKQIGALPPRLRREPLEALGERLLHLAEDEQDAAAHAFQKAKASYAGKNSRALDALNEAVDRRVARTYSGEMSQAIRDGASVREVAYRWLIQSDEVRSRLEADAATFPNPATKEVFSGKNAQEVAARYGILNRRMVDRLECAALIPGAQAYEKVGNSGLSLREIAQAHGLKGRESHALLESRFIQWVSSLHPRGSEGFDRLLAEFKR